MSARRLIAALAACLAFESAPALADEGGKQVYDSACAGCHGTGVLGAPKVGDTAAWKARSGGGLPSLVASAKAGKGAMPPRGGSASLSDAQLLSAVAYMMSASGMSVSGVAAAVRPPPAAPAVQAAAAQAPAAPVVAAVPASVNSFNRLLRPSLFNRPPTEDQIHDPANDGTQALQPPLTAFGDLPKSNAGNRVDWVKSLNQGKIVPRADRTDPKAAPAVMDLNIVREVKGSMPDVVYPHKQHTEWLDCSNCHPAIFKPQKGANQISMAGILLGEACGVCHGKVAFPVSECRLCHSKAKAPTAAAATK
ncbi:MAG: c-type cytochrome [Burkholderiales bacterium]|nr:c-type cytochrome [Burkholderiales bacterium]